VTCSLYRGAKEECSGEREVAGRDDAGLPLACERVDLVVVLCREPARADDDVDTPLDGGENVRAKQRRA
jgi:hypothetical protein